MHNKTAHLLINIKIIIFRAMGIKINQIMGFSGQMQDLLMSIFFFFLGSPFSWSKSCTHQAEGGDKYKRQEY